VHVSILGRFFLVFAISTDAFTITRLLTNYTFSKFAEL